MEKKKEYEKMEIQRLEKQKEKHCDELKAILYEIDMDSFLNIKPKGV